MEAGPNVPEPRAGLAGARVATVLVFVRDFPRMLAFYRDTLGLRVGFANEHFAELHAASGADIALHAGAEGPPPAETDETIEFRVEDIEAVRNSLLARGVPVEPVQTEPFGRIARFRDPENHRLGLEQPPTRSSE